MVPLDSNLRLFRLVWTRRWDQLFTFSLPTSFKAFDIRDQSETCPDGQAGSVWNLSQWTGWISLEPVPRAPSRRSFQLPEATIPLGFRGRSALPPKRGLHSSFRLILPTVADRLSDAISLRQVSETFPLFTPTFCHGPPSRCDAFFSCFSRHGSGSSMRFTNHCIDPVASIPTRADRGRLP